jgi:16S rRNA (guanine527-N7)-methyltransferase
VKPPPPAALTVFGRALPLATTYAHLLATDGVARGVVGPGEPSRLWERHLLNCAVVADAVPRGASVCDLGSGAGLPGLVWALVRPDLRITLLEPSLRRTAFLCQAIELLQLGHVGVVRARAEDHASSMTYRVVTARAVAPLGRLAAWALPLCEPAGEVIAFKGSRASQEAASAEAVLWRLGVSSWQVEQWGVGLVDPPATTVRLRRQQE